MTATRTDNHVNPRLVVNVSPEQMEALEKAAKASYITKSAKIRQIVLEHLKDHGYLKQTEDE